MSSFDAVGKAPILLESRPQRREKNDFVVEYDGDPGVLEKGPELNELDSAPPIHIDPSTTAPALSGLN